MVQIEVTTKVKQTLKEVDNILTKQGFFLIRKSRIEDKYMTQNYNELTKNNILEMLKKCVLIRYLCVNGEQTFKKLTYKNKVYADSVVVSEEKINVNIEDIDKAEKLFNALGFKNLVDVNYDVIVYQKGQLELAFQDVEGLGLLLEYENLNDFDGYTTEEIISEKEKMLNEIRSYNLDITNDYDVKKAFELIVNKL